MSLLHRSKIIALAEEAGRAILKLYRSGEWNVTEKVDESPLTQADLASHHIIVDGLRKLTQEPIVSEEDATKLLSAPDRFWLIDPLDGTRDFIAKLDTFVVCIALINHGQVEFGVIHAPVTGETYWAERGFGAHGPRGLIVNQQKRTELIAAGSRSTPSDRMRLFQEHFQIKEFKRFGSALKFCKLAEGDFDLYPRFGPTHEWDTAAGQIICEEVGCKVIDIATKNPLVYGKSQWLNGGFIASRNDLDIVGEIHRQGGFQIKPK